MGGMTNKSTTIGYRYYMAILAGLCRGPIDEVTEIKVGDKTAWPAVGYGSIEFGQYPPPNTASLTQTMPFTILADKLFGGEKGEGGIEGNGACFMGEETQDIGPNIRAMMGGYVSDVRGIVSIWFDGMICALNPYPKPWKFRLRRTLAGWDGPVWQPDLCRIPMAGGAIHGMNPAHIIYECATNRPWGRGYNRSRIDEASFLKAAQRLYDEQFGLCMRWTRQEKLSEFVKTVIDHIGGSLYTSRETGLITLDLIRGDYDPDDVPHFDYSNGLISVDAPEVATKDDEINEIVVTYHSPVTDEDKQVRAHNLASITTQGGAINSQTAQYQGAPTAELATRLALRDLKAAATSGRRFSLKLSRRAWKIAPGKVLKITAPDKGIKGVILRVGKVEIPNLKTGEILIEAGIDVYGLPSAAYVSAQPTSWTPPSRGAVAPPDRLVREATYRDLVRNLSRADLAQVLPQTGFVATMASRPTPLSMSYQVMTRTADEAYQGDQSETWAPALTLATACGPYDGTIAFNAVSDTGLIRIGSAVQVGGEICRVDGITYAPTGLSGTLQVSRGCVDTLPAYHTAGEVIFFFDDYMGSDGREYAPGEVVDVKMLTSTSSETLSLEDAPTDTLVINGRQNLPYPPGNMRANEALVFGSVPKRKEIVLTWAHRNRVLQNDQILDHLQPSVAPEDGTFYQIGVFNGGTLLRVVNNFTGDTWTYTEEMAATDNNPSSILFSIQTFRGSAVAREAYVFAVPRG